MSPIQLLFYFNKVRNENLLQMKQEEKVEVEKDFFSIITGT